MKQQATRFGSLLAAALTAAAFVPAHAQTSGSTTTTTTTTRSSSSDYSVLPYTRKGYVGINVGRPEYTNACGSAAFSCDDPDASLNVYTGGMFNDVLGLELGYLNMGRADRAGGQTRAQGLNLSLLARVPLGSFNVFAKGGATYGRTEVTSSLLSGVPSGKESGWGSSYGGGVGYDFTPSSGIVLEWQRHNFHFAGIGREGVKATSLGYVHRF